MTYSVVGVKLATDWHQRRGIRASRPRSYDQDKDNILLLAQCFTTPFLAQVSTSPACNADANFRLSVFAC